MPLPSLALLLLLLLLPTGADAGEVDVLQVMARAGREQQLLAAAATFSAPLPRISSASSASPPPLPVVLASVAGDCEAVSGDIQGAVALLDRGGSCSFLRSARAAQDAGAALVVVRDTVVGAFESARRLGGSAIHDCALGEAAVERNASEAEGYPAVLGASASARRCAGSRACASNACVYTGARAGDAFQVCCFKSALVRMTGGSSGDEKLAIPAVFVSFRDGQELGALLAAGAVAVRALNAEENPWNPSMLVTWALGVSTVVAAALYASSDERQRSSQSGGDARDGYVAIDERLAPPVPATARFEVSTRHALLFLVGASGLLLLLFYTHVRFVLAVLFALGASAALAQVATGPLWAAIAPKVEPSLGGLARVPRSLLALVAPGVGVLWFVERAQAWVWPLQDLLCVALCVVCVDAVRLPSLRVAAALLAAAFAYDVFFVYLSPLVFGANVMVDVASGNALLSLSQQQAQQAEAAAQPAVPMVLVVPLVFSVYGGSALLGLGDIILPGLLAALCARYDYCSGAPLSRGFFCVATAAYAVGLLLANAMAIALRDVVAGQPALMYIVPLMLASVLGFAQHKGEIRELWDGPACLEVASEARDSGDEREREREGEGEREPLLQLPADRV